MTNTAIIPSNTDKKIAFDLLENSMTVSGWSASITMLILSPFLQEPLRETFSSYSLPLYEYLQSSVEFVSALPGYSTARISSISASTEISLTLKLCTYDKAVNPTMIKYATISLKPPTTKVAGFPSEKTGSQTSSLQDRSH